MSAAGSNPDIESARAAVAQRPQDAGAHYALALAYDRARETDAAIESLRAALQITPGFAQAHNLLGILLAGRGDVEAAIESFRRAIATRPGYARAYNNLGNSLRTLGHIAEAERAIAEAVRLQPDYQLAQHNLGAIRQALGLSDEAVVALNESLRLNPKFQPSWSALAAAERQRGRFDESIAAYRNAIGLDPVQSAADRIGLAQTLAECGFHDESRRTYAEAQRRHPDSIPAALGFNLGLPLFYADSVAIDRARAQFAAGLNALEREFERLHAGVDAYSMLESWRWTNFALAYQGRDDRELQQRYARLVARAIDEKAPVLRQPFSIVHEEGARIRIGFASAFFVDGTVGHYFLRWITELDRFGFEVFVYHLASYTDALTQQIASRADWFRHTQGVAATIAALARAIRNDTLDVLVYPELGMDERCMVLAAMRLAPLQCAGWGHPVTTGHETVDVFFSARAMEPDDAEAHYSEQLVRLPGIGTSYPRPGFERDPADRSTVRERIDVPLDAPVFICSQALFKILPDDDLLLARVLEAVPGSMLVLFADRHAELTALVSNRLEQAFASRGIVALDRVRVQARMSRADFLRVNAACDAMLDTTAWSGGNSTIDALVAGLPVVTLPGQFMRARQSAAMLAIAGVPELIARDVDDYVRIAARLGKDPAWRADVAAKIAAGREKLFDDPAPLAAFADFIRDAHSRAHGSAPPPSGG